MSKLPISLWSHHGYECLERWLVVVEDEHVLTGVDQLLHDQILAASAKVDLFLFGQVFVVNVIAVMEEKTIINNFVH